jgi:hypothetical protein
MDFAGGAAAAPVVEHASMAIAKPERISRKSENGGLNIRKTPVGG